MRIRSSRYGVAPWVVVVLLMSSPAAAESSRVLYLGGEKTPSDVAAILALLNPPINLEQAPEPLAEAFPAGELGTVGVESVQACTGEPVDAAGYLALLADLVQATMELGETDTLLARLETAQACLTEPVAPEDLAQADFLEGVIAFSDGDPDGAERAFREALVLDRDLAWNPEYPPDTQLRFANAATAVAQQEPSVLHVVVGEGMLLWLDGEPVAPSPEGLGIAPGRHVLQVRRGAGEATETLSLEVAAGTVGAVVEEGGLAVRDERILAQRASALLAALATEAPDVKTYVVALEPSLAIWTHDAQTRSASRVPVTVAAGALASPDGGKSVKNPAKAAPVTLGVGAAMLVAGAVIAGVYSGKMDDMRVGVAAGEIPYPHADAASHTDAQLDNEALFGTYRSAGSLGVGLMAAGGVTMAVSIPLVIAGKRQQLSVAAAFDPGPPGDPGPRGVLFTVGVKP